MPRPPESTHLASALAEVRAIYRAVEERPLPRSCVRRTQCCQFQLTGRQPHLTRAEALLLLRAWRATGRRDLPAGVEGACPFLDLPTGRCAVYADRPFGCRTHFCAEAGGPYPRRHLLDLIRRLEDADRLLGGDGPRPLEAALTRVWARQGRGE